MHIFYCENCHKKFKKKGKVVTWHDSIYGACRKRVAACPKCKSEVGEFRPKRTVRGDADFSSVKKNASSSCATGACPYVN